MDPKRYTDEYGRVIVDAEEAFELFYGGDDVFEHQFEMNDNIVRYNEFCRKFDKADFVLASAPEILHTPEEEHSRRANTWFVPTKYAEMDVLEYLLSKCSNDDERERVRQEYELFDRGDLVTIIRLMIYMVDNLRENKILWGVGRGSSVASFIMYLIGIHRINPMKYNLPVTDFLR